MAQLSGKKLDKDHIVSGRVNPLDFNTVDDMIDNGVFRATRVRSHSALIELLYQKLAKKELVIK